MILKLISEILAWALLVFKEPLKQQHVHFTWGRVMTEVHDCPESICTVTAVLMRGNGSFSEIWLHKTLILDTKLDSYSYWGSAEKFYRHVLLLLLYLSLGYVSTIYICLHRNVTYDPSWVIQGQKSACSESRTSLSCTAKHHPTYHTWLFSVS